MEQTEIDILCINTQIQLSRQGAKLVDMLQSGDTASQAFASVHMALYSQMRAIKDYDVASGDLTDEQQFQIQENIGVLVNDCNKYV